MLTILSPCYRPKAVQSILVLLGPTAVGKTAVINRLAAFYKAVVYADTACLYKNLNIASAKPTITEQAIIPHYLIDCLNLDEQFDANQYVTKADAAIAQLDNDSRPLIVSGGSLFYLQSFLFGASQAPSVAPLIRAKIKEELNLLGEKQLHQRLQQVDPLSAARIHPHDHYRLIRALEVFEASGQPLSSFSVSKTFRSLYNFKIVILERERQELYQRINDRVEQMLDNGLEDEIATLKAMGATANTPAMKAIGYAEWFNSNLTTTHQIKEAIKQNSRRYAKRQITFLQQLKNRATIIHPDQLTSLNFF